MANFSKDKARRIYLSLTDQKEIVGVPLNAFKNVTIFFFVIFIIFGRGFIGMLTVAGVYVTTLAYLRSICAKDMYNLSILMKYLLEHKDTYDA